MKQKIQRLLLVISYVQRNKGAKVADVARVVGMTTEELKASVPALSMIGRPPFQPDDLIDISIDGQDRMYVYLDQALGKPLRLTQQEWLALAIALQTLGGSGAGHYAETAQAILGKLKGLLANGEGAAELERQFAIEGEDRAVQVVEKFRVLERGLEEGRRVEIVYYTASRGELSTRRLDPYALIQFLGSWYAVGHDDHRNEVRIFKVERIREARLTEERFERPADFRADKYARSRMLVGPLGGVARIRFPAALAQVIAEEHPPERVHAQPDGGVELELEYHHPEWVAGWVLSFAGAAQVLGPDEVRAAVAARCTEALAHYPD